MLTVHRASERHLRRSDQADAWFTFDRAASLQRGNGFGALEMLKEGRLRPSTSNVRPLHDAEILTYVRSGTVTFEDTMGRRGSIVAGEFQRMTGGQGTRYSESNASTTEWAHVFQFWFRLPAANIEPEYEQKRFSLAQRRGAFRVVASPDARLGSLRVRQNIVMYSAILESGRHIARELDMDHRAWLQVLHGSVRLGELTLEPGDGVGLESERTIAFTALEECEVILVEMGPRGV